MRAIVGNGPLSLDDRALIATADRIIRFNLTPNLCEELDARTTELFLSCSSKQIGEFLSQGQYHSNSAFHQATRVVLPYHPDIIKKYMRPPSILSRLKGRRADWSKDCLKIAGQTGKSTEILPADLYLKACYRLSIIPEKKEFFPSSGCLSILRELQSAQHSASELHVFGFGYVGWKRHSWAEEKALVTELENAGELKMHAVEVPI
jgi:hypothetical protein